MIKKFHSEINCMKIYLTVKEKHGEGRAVDIIVGPVLCSLNREEKI